MPSFRFLDEPAFVHGFPFPEDDVRESSGLRRKVGLCVMPGARTPVPDKPGRYSAFAELRFLYDLHVLHGGIRLSPISMLPETEKKTER